MTNQERIIKGEEQAVAYLQRDAAHYYKASEYCATRRCLIGGQEASATQYARARIGLLGLLEAKK